MLVLRRGFPGPPLKYSLSSLLCEYLQFDPSSQFCPKQHNNGAQSCFRVTGLGGSHTVVARPVVLAGLGFLTTSVQPSSSDTCFDGPRSYLSLKAVYISQRSTCNKRDLFSFSFSANILVLFSFRPLNHSSSCLASLFWSSIHLYCTGHVAQLLQRVPPERLSEVNSVTF